MCAGDLVRAIMDLDAEVGAWFFVELVYWAQLTHRCACVFAGELRVLTSGVDKKRTGGDEGSEVYVLEMLGQIAEMPASAMGLVEKGI